MMDTDYTRQYQSYQALVERELIKVSSGWHPAIGEAMSYSLLAGGKRVRPALLLASCDAMVGDLTQAIPYAAAIEMIHAYSLIHDDLPSMDDDDLRRGKPTNHIVHGEAMAILAGDGLLSQAFQTMSSAAFLHPNQRAALLAMGVVATGCGVEGMVLGQVLDIQNEGQDAQLDDVLKVHHLKTGALIRSAAVAGAILGGAGMDALDAFSTYGEHIGLAFQIMDDLLDESATAEELGKTPHKDLQQGKATFATLFTREQALELCQTHIREASAAIAAYDRQGFLVAMASKMGERTR